MKRTTAIGLLLLVCFLSSPPASQARPKPKKKSSGDLNIRLDPASRDVVLSWKGGAVLQRASIADGQFKKVAKRPGRSHELVIEPTGAGSVYRVEKAANNAVVSVNIVGYVNLDLPPGLSLLANPLYYTNNSVAFWMPNMPDGCQVYKLTPSAGYEVSTFDALAGTWSNPELDLPIGAGFHFLNASTQTLQLRFVGEVQQGELINPLPAGVSLKGSLVPQFGSINTLHGIPGEAGDELRFYVNDLQGGGEFQSSFYVDGIGWVPDRSLGVGEGFYAIKQHAQDWVRIFFAF